MIFDIQFIEEQIILIVILLGSTIRSTVGHAGKFQDVITLSLK